MPDFELVATFKGQRIFRFTSQWKMLDHGETDVRGIRHSTPVKRKEPKITYGNFDLPDRQTSLKAVRDDILFRELTHRLKPTGDNL